MTSLLQVGARKERHKTASYQIKEGDYVNTDVTAPGATLALGLMFFDTSNRCALSTDVNEACCSL